MLSLFQFLAFPLFSASSTTISESMKTASARSTKLKSTSLGEQLTTISASVSSLSSTASGKLSSPSVKTISTVLTKTALQQSQQNESNLKLGTVVGATVGGGVGLVALGGGAYLLNSWVSRDRVSPLNINRSV